MTNHTPLTHIRRGIMSKFTWSAGLLSLLVASSLSAQATQPKTESKKAAAVAPKSTAAPAVAPVQAKPKDTTHTAKVKDTKAPRHADATTATADQMKKAQQALADKGLYKGKVTGRTNAAFRAAVKQFQKDNQLKVTGRLNQETLAKLNIS